MEEEVIQEPGYVPKHISYSDLEEYTDQILKETEDFDEMDSSIEEEKSKYPISEEKAIEIARPELKKVYVSHHREGISGLYFTDFLVTLLGTGEEKWYKVEVTEGDISYIIEEEDKTTFLDGKLEEESLKELVGYVNAHTGEFEYDEGGAS